MMTSTLKHHIGWQLFGLLTLIIAMLFILPPVAFADDAQAGSQYVTLNEAFQQAAGNWISPLQTVAKSVFWSLAFFELILVSVPLALKGADLGEFAFALVKLILFLGFFYALVLNGARWMNDIIQSFLQVGATAGGVSYQGVGGVLDLGVQTALKIMGQYSIWHGDGVGTALILFIGALLILICFAVIAVLLALALFESYFVIGAASLFFALGGMQFTAEYARNTFMVSLSIGAKLMMLELITGTGYRIVEQWVNQYQQNDASLFGLIGLVLMFALACAYIPNVVSRLFGGSGGGHPFGAVLAGAGALTGAALAGKAAFALAGAQLAENPGMTAASSLASGEGLGSGAAMTGAAGGSANDDNNPAASSNLGGPISGRSSNPGATGNTPALSAVPRMVARTGLAAAHLAVGTLKHLGKGAAMGHAMADDMNLQRSLLGKPVAPPGQISPSEDSASEGGSLSGSADRASPLDTEAGRSSGHDPDGNTGSNGPRSP